MIETPRLIIRPWSAQDIDYYKAMASDVGYTCFSIPGYFVTQNDEEVSKRIEQRIKLFDEHKIGKFLAFEKSTGDFIGTCGGDFFTHEEKPEIELGYRIMLAHWGKGYATEAAEALTKYMLKELDKDVIYAFALHQNQQSKKILEKVGFTYKKDFLFVNLPHKFYELSKESI